MMNYSSELDSFDIINDVHDYLLNTTDIVAAMQLKDLDNTVHIIKGKIQGLQSVISNERVKLLSGIIAETTTQNISHTDITKQLQRASSDVSWFDMWVRPGIDSRDLLVRSVQKLINDSKQSVYMDFLDVLRGRNGMERANRKYEKWMKQNGKNAADMAKRNEPFLTLVEKKTKKGEDRSYWEIVNEESASDEGKEKYRKLMALPSTDPRREYYHAFVNRFMEAQKAAFGEGKHKFGYRLPMMRKQTYERLVGEGGAKKIWNAAKEGFKDTFTTREDDLEYRLVTKYDTDENGNVIKTVPVYFDQYIEPADVSLDMATTLMMSTHNLMEYRELNRIMPTLWALRSSAEQRQVDRAEQTGLFGVLKRLVDRKGFNISREGRDSRAYKQISMIMDQHVYGEKKAQADLKVTIPVIGKEIRVQKFFDLVNRWTSLRVMSFNLNIALSNVFTGEAMMLQEAFAGRFFNLKDWRWAGKVASLEYPRVIADSYSRKNRSKVSAFLELLNIRNDFSAAMQELGQKGSNRGTAYESLAHSARAFQDAGESMVMAQSALAA